MATIGFRLRDDRLPIEELIELARRAEARGYDALFMPEGSGRDAFVQLAAFACATSRVRLGTGIVSIFSRTPGALAQAAVTLDQLSHGRAILGLGTTSEASVIDGQGMAFERPLRRMREYVLLLKAILRGDARLPEAEVVPVRRFSLQTEARADLPIQVAALGPRMCRLAGAVADGVILNWASPAYVRDAVANVRAGAERAGRDPASVEVVCYFRVAGGPADDATRHALALDLANYVMQPHYRAMLDAEGFAEQTRAVAAAYPDDPDKAARLIPDAMLEALSAIGSAAAQTRAEEYRKLGVDLPVLAPLMSRSNSVDSWRAAIDLL